MNTNISFRGALAAASLSLCLAACGGGGSGDAVNPSAAVPGTDNSTIQSFLAYQSTLAPVPTVDPQTLQMQLAPLDDTAEPTALN